MKIKVKYFGLLAEKTNSFEEVLNIEKTNDLRHFFELKHPSLLGLKYQIAVNQKITNELTESSQITEIALLPPFAGG